MLRGLTQAGLGIIASSEELINLAAKYGFQALDLDPLELISTYGADKAKNLLSESGIVLGAFGLPAEWRASEEEFRAGLPELVRMAEAGRLLGSSSCATYILPSTDLDPARFMMLATRRLRQCADVLEAYDIPLALEFVGPHHLRTQWKHPFLWEMGDTLEWIRTINKSNVGLLLDAYHWYTNELDVEAVRRLRSDQIIHVHINDARDVPIEQVLDNDRLYPGEGIIDLPGFLGALRDINYHGIVAQEILTPVPPNQPLEELLQRSREGFFKVFKGHEPQ
jgi:sugar phosphate isomerase/epimerase